MALYGILVVSILLASSTILIQHWVKLDKIKPELEKGFTEFLTRNLTVNRLGWEFFPVPTLVAYEVSLWEDEKTLIAFSPRVKIGVSLLSAIKGSFKVQNLTFINPKGVLRRRKNGGVPLAEMIKSILEGLRKVKKEKGLQKSKLEVRVIEIENGRVQIWDQMLQADQVNTYLQVDAAGEIQGEPGRRRFPFWLNSQIFNQEQTGTFSIHGVLKKYPKVRIQSESFPLGALRPWVPFLQKWAGLTTLQVDLERTERGLEWDLEGETKGIKPSGPIPFPQIKVTYSIKPGSPSRVAVNLNGKKSKGNLQILFPKFGSAVVKGKLTSDQFDIEELLEWKENLGALPFMGRASKEPSSQSKSQSPFVNFQQKTWDATFDIALTNVRYREASFDSFNMKIQRYSSGTVRMDLTEAKGMNGTLTAQAALDYKDNPHADPFYAIRWNLDGMDVEPLLRALRAKQLVSGSGHSEGEIKGSTGHLTWDHAEGHMIFELRDGMLWETPSILKAFSRLNVKSLLRETKNNDRKGFPYNQAKVQLKLREGKVVVDPPGVFESDTVHLGFMGSVDLKEKTIDGKMVFQFLTVVGDVLKAVPGVKQILYGKQKGLIPIWVSIRGPVTDPSITVLPFQSVTNSLWKTIERVFRLPFRSSNPEDEERSK